LPQYDLLPEDGLKQKDHSDARDTTQLWCFLVLTSLLISYASNLFTQTQICYWHNTTRNDSHKTLTESMPYYHEKWLTQNVDRQLP
jgi:hypothetical protein